MIYDFPSNNGDACLYLYLQLIVSQSNSAHGLGLGLYRYYHVVTMLYISGGDVIIYCDIISVSIADLQT